ncbi:MAG TPA: biliverdin-producing heme oxygenase [Dyadobacter sp.]|jgi:heme oxygenase|nr:biliverdin-producing heme oxygenase [Dyadobacter sp.]
MNVTSVGQDTDIFLSNLRAATAASHKGLEDNERSKGILSPEISIQIYQEYLAKMYGVVAGCERDVYPILSGLFQDLEERKKAHLILKDLQVTGMDQHNIDQLNIHTFTPANVAEALGIMYVLEGSTLGGKVLFRHVHKVLGLDENSGAAFFWGYGTETGPKWKSFVSAFADYAIQNEAQQNVIQGATDCFTAVDNWLKA